MAFGFATRVVVGVRRRSHRSSAGCGDDPGSPRPESFTCIRLRAAKRSIRRRATCSRPAARRSSWSSRPACVDRRRGRCPPVSRMTEAEYAQRLTDLILAEDPAAESESLRGRADAAKLVVPGAFQPASMAATQASQVLGFYRHDPDDIVLIDRGQPGDDVSANGVLLHELVHALQDRDQDLGAWYDGRTDSYDGALAAMSVVEGEARLHQKRFAVSAAGTGPEHRRSREAFRGLGPPRREMGAEQPSPYLASRSVFPYEFGARRLWPRLMQRGPQAIADIFSRLPRTRARCSTPATTPPCRRGLRRSRPRRRRSGR